MATFTEGGVRVDVTLRNLNVSSNDDMFSRTVEFTVQVWAAGAKSEAVDEWCETWGTDNMSGYEGFDAGDLYNLIDPDGVINPDELLALEGVCDSIWEEQVIDWFETVSGEIYTAQQSVIPEYIERANDGAFDKVVTA